MNDELLQDSAIILNEIKNLWFLDSSTSSEWQIIFGWQIILNACQAEFSSVSRQKSKYWWCGSETSSEWLKP